MRPAFGPFWLLEAFAQLRHVTDFCFLLCNFLFKRCSFSHQTSAPSPFLFLTRSFTHMHAVSSVACCLSGLLLWGHCGIWGQTRAPVIAPSPVPPPGRAAAITHQLVSTNRLKRLWKTASARSKPCILLRANGKAGYRKTNCVE